MKSKFIIFILFTSLFASSKGYIGEYKERYTPSEKKAVALIIGNADYSKSRYSNLKNPLNDVKAMRDILIKYGFKRENIVYGENVNENEFGDKIEEFNDKVTNDSFAFVYFSGHGTYYNGINYLVPSKERITKLQHLSSKAIALKEIQDAMSHNKNGLKIIVLDACRNNPFEKGGSGGLGAQEGRGDFIAYAAKVGGTTLDSHPNRDLGFYTGELIDLLEDRNKVVNKSINAIFDEVKDNVYIKSNRKIEPANYNNAFGIKQFYLVRSDDIENDSKLKKKYNKSVIKVLLEEANRYYYFDLKSKRALDLYKIAQNYGSDIAKAQIGKMYILGRGVDKDEDKGLQFIKESLNSLKKEAKTGDRFAEYLLGYMYQDGYIVDKDYKEAVKWYKKSAIQGEAVAQNNLGSMYQDGYGVEKNYAEAIKWYKKATEQGFSVAQYNLGYVYENGHGVEKDYKEAIKWYKKAAEQGLSSAQANLGIMYENGYGVEKDYKEAVKWYKKSAIQGEAVAQNNLGYVYENGHGVEKDYKEAIKWYKKAAEQGLSSAQANLGIMYENGYGVEKDYKEAVKWYKKSAIQGEAVAQYNLGYVYENGHGVEKDYKEAIKWYKKAADKEDEKAQNNLGYMYLNGYGVDKNYKEAIKWFKKATEKGCASAQANLGVMYENGYGVEKDIDKAIEYYKLAIKQGDEYAKKALERLLK